MIITQDPITVETNVSKAKRSAFTVKADGKLFQILTKNLYANPVLSTLSEAGQNAFDSHKRAGKMEVPFTVTLPSPLDPRLIVRDYGVSMSHSYVMDEYCTAFESSKDTDANQSGGFGVGRLACLALSTTYNITCFSDGKKRVYAIYFNNEGVPEISHIHTVATDEPTGVEITVPIQEKDIYQFEKAAKEAYRFYNPKPVIKGVRDFQFHTNLRTLNGTNWEIDNSISHPVAVGGVYYYKIEVENIPNLTKLQSELLNSGLGLVLYFNASEIHPQANRQGLFYNEATCNAIKKRLDELEEEIKLSVQKEFDKCQSMIEAKRLWLNYFDYRGMTYKIGRVFGDMSAVYWNGHKITDGYLRTYEVDPLDSTKNKFIPGVVLHAYSCTVGKRKTAVNQTVENRMLVAPQCKMYRNDLDGGRGAKYRIGYMLSQAPNRENTVYYGIRFKTAEAEKEFHRINLTDASLFESAAAIDVPASATLSCTDNTKHKVKVFKFIPPWNDPTGNRASTFWEAAETEIDIDEGGVFTTIHRFQIEGRTNKQLSDILDTMKDRGLVSDKIAIYGVKTTTATGKAQPAVLAELQASEDWIELETWIKEEREKILPTDPNFMQAIVDSAEGGYGNMTEIATKDRHKFVSPLFVDYLTKVDFINAQKKRAEDYEEAVAAYRRLGGVISQSGYKPTYDMSAEWDTILNRYPMLEKFSRYEFSQDYEAAHNLMLDYIAMIEEVLAYREKSPLIQALRSA